MGKGLENTPLDLVEGFDQINKACEYGMVSATIMKKQYQDIFTVNEKERQKRQRSNRPIQREEGLTREEAAELTIPDAEPVEQPVIQPPVPGQVRDCLPPSVACRARAHVMEWSNKR
ncbi:conserved hypothetical protein [Histoplasma capsulatum var. duboisii H88]|uniref:Uncharacterized protein n=1 Tax=Ajellomyces capsulatus (strain H88) TaxID=544711 RepID=F0UV39_AJEC8|nr:conserved hypothetical protein [Histoplasma capsulatum var. duboisii H88]